MEPNELWWLAAGLAVGVLFSWFARALDHEAEEHRKSAAEAVLLANGLSSHHYRASTGNKGAPPELREALDRLSLGSRIVLDNEGRVVGGVLPRAYGARRLRLVVDNDREESGSVG